MKLQFRDSVIDFPPEFYQYSGLISKLKEDTNVSDDHIVDLTQFDSCAGRLMSEMINYPLWLEDEESPEFDWDGFEQIAIQYDASEILQTLELSNFLDIEKILNSLSGYLDDLLTHIVLSCGFSGEGRILSLSRRIFGYKDQSLSLTEEEVESMEPALESVPCASAINLRFAKSGYVPSYDVAKFLYNYFSREAFIVFQKLHPEIYNYFTEHERRVRIEEDYCLSETTSIDDVYKFRIRGDSLQCAFEHGNVNLLINTVKQDNKDANKYLLTVVKNLKKEDTTKVQLLMENHKYFPDFWSIILGYVSNPNDMLSTDVSDLIAKCVEEKLKKE